MAAYAAEDVGEARGLRMHSADAAGDADSAPQRNTHPQRAEITAPAASALVAAGAASSTHAVRAMALPAVTSAATQPAVSGLAAASAPAAQPNVSAAPSVMDTGAAATSSRGGTPAGIVLRDGDGDGGQAISGQLAAQEQGEAAPPSQHAADGPLAGPSPMSIVCERGSGPPGGASGAGQLAGADAYALSVRVSEGSG